MVKANIETASGTKIVLDGTSEELAQILAVVQQKEEKSLKKERPKVASNNKREKSGSSLTDMLIEIREEGYFDRPQGLVEIKQILEEKGHIYPITTLSPMLLRLVKKRMLRRMKEEKRWVYVKGSI